MLVGPQQVGAAGPGVVALGGRAVGGQPVHPQRRGAGRALPHSGYADQVAEYFRRLSKGSAAPKKN